MKMRIYLYAWMVFLAATVVSSSLYPQGVHAQEISYQEDFEDGQAQGWELEAGWQVILDGSNHVLAGQGHFWARSNQSFEDDYHLSFRLKVIRGAIHLVYRLNDTGRYFVHFESFGDTLGKQYWPNDFRNDLISGTVQHSLNVWHHVEIVGQGNTLYFLVDGNQEWTYTDSQPLANGSFAFETLDDSQAYVDDILVTLESTQPSVPSAATPAAPPSSPTSLTWARTSGPLGGLGYDIRMRPDNPDIMFVTDAWAGAFASNDGGQTWFLSSDGITTRTGPSGDAIPVFSLTIDPNNPEIVWAGTQFQRGIFKSTDGGRTWKKMDSGVRENEGITFRGFTIQPGDSNVVYAAAEVSSWAWTPNHQERIGREFDMTRGVIYKTKNGGRSWEAVWRGDNLARYIWINPHNTNIVYISTGIFDREAANSDPVAGIPGGEGVLKSTDGGTTWTNVNNGLGNLYVGSLFMHPTNPDILLAGTGSNPYETGEGVYLSLDGGNSWTQTLASKGAITSVEIAQSNPNIAYAGSRFAVYRSEDGGRTWVQMTSGGNFWGSPGAQTGFPIDFQVDPRNPDRIFTNAYGGGAFLSEDGGRTWRDVSQGYTGAQVRDLAVNPAAPGSIIAVARSGVFASYDGGATWMGINPSSIDSIEWNVITVDPSNPQHLIGGLNVHGWLVNSDDGGETWRTVAGPYENRIGWRAIAFSPSDPKIVYAGSAGFYTASTFEASQPGIGVFVSIDNGNSWSPANDGLTQDADVSALAVDPSNPQMVFAATTNHGLLKTTDGGQSWTTLKGGWSGDSLLLSVAVSPVDANAILLGVNRGGIFKSVDGGQTWRRSASGLVPEASISDIVFDPTNPDEVLYLADLQSGVYRSTNGGTTWTVISDGLYSRSVNALALSRDGLHLYAATEGNGVYRLDLNGQPPIAVPRPTLVPPQTLPPVNTTAPTSPFGKLPCGSMLILPIALLGLIWLRTRDKVIRR
jgi:photosystem II stability/assembly factor-like uncharacterized protein